MALAVGSGRDRDKRGYGGLINSTGPHCVSWFSSCLTNSKEKESILEEEFAMTFQSSVCWLHF